MRNAVCFVLFQLASGEPFIFDTIFKTISTVTSQAANVVNNAAAAASNAGK